MKFELPNLPYAYDALEPYIDERTMFIHHTKHHQGYTNNLNASLEGLSLEGYTAEEIIANVNELVPESIRQTVINNGGGYVNHNLFFFIMGPKNNELKGEIKNAIEEEFGGFDEFRAEFEQAAKTQFGSGWAFLVVDPSGKLKVVKKPNQNSPLTDGDTPILALDVWEHAYYLKYQNKRPDYVSNFWKVVNWDEVNKNYLKTVKK
jgi:superoxide dismutase, Fe-Mn family